MVLQIEDKIDELISFVDINNVIPKQNINKFSNDDDMGKFWIKCKNQDKLENEPYSKIIINDLLFNDYQKEDKMDISNVHIINNFQKRKYHLLNKNYTKSSNKDFLKLIPKLTIENKIKEFLTFVEKNNIIPYIKTKTRFTDGSNMGHFWISCKYRYDISKEPFNILLSNKLLKNNYQKYINTKYNEKISLSTKNLTITDKIKELIFFVKQNNIVPNDNKYKFSNGSSILNFWKNCRRKYDLYKKPYNILLLNKSLNDNYQRYLNNKKCELPIENKIKELLLFVEKNNIIPKQNIHKFSNDKYIYDFWYTCKSKCYINKYPYDKLLTNKLLKENYEIYSINIKTENKINEFLNMVKKNNEIPDKKSKCKFEDNTDMYTFWMYCKRIKNLKDKPYSKLLTNNLLKHDYDLYLTYKCNIIIIKNKIEQLLLFIKINNKIPKEDSNYKFYDNTNIGGFWIKCKNNLNLVCEPYKKLLSNKLLKKDYRQHLLKRLIIIENID
jgi:hypothetical protein